METNKIDIANSISDLLATRQIITSLFETVNSLSPNQLILDFAKVKFISRSGADQLLKEIEKTNKEIKLLNMNEVVSKMFDAVKKTQTGKDRQLQEAPIIEFSNLMDLRAFLRTV